MRFTYQYQYNICCIMRMKAYKLVVDMQRTLFCVKSQCKESQYALLLQCYSKLYQWRDLRSELVHTVSALEWMSLFQGFHCTTVLLDKDWDVLVSFHTALFKLCNNGALCTTHFILD